MDDSKFFEELYIAKQKELYYMANAVVHNPDLARDIVQNVFLVAQEKLDSLKASPSPSGWLVVTLRNILRNTYKQQKRLLDMTAPLDGTETVCQAASVQTEYEGIIRHDELEMLIRIYCDKWSYQEVADNIGISLDACRKRIQRARLHLKEALEKENN